MSPNASWIVKVADISIGYTFDCAILYQVIQRYRRIT